MELAQCNSERTYGHSLHKDKYDRLFPNLLANPERVDVPVRDVPVEETVRAVCRHRDKSRHGAKH